MNERRAVLIGVAKNKRDSTLDLPIVYNDISLLHSALESCGYLVTSYGIDTSSEVSALSIEDAINDACIEAPLDSTLLLYFTGHGIHYNGKDLLVPWDGHFEDYSRIERCLVSTDISHFIARSRARLVVFFIDACRGGLNWETKSVNLKEWGRGKIQSADQRQFILVYSCRPGELSQYVGGQHGFSLFTKALATVIAPTHPAESIEEVINAAQEELDKLVREYKKNEQHIRIAGEQELTSEYLSYKISDRQGIEDNTGGIDARWQDVATATRLWRLVNSFEHPSGPFFIERSSKIVTACEHEWLNADSTLPNDPWRDHTYPLRVVSCLEMLVNSSPELNLSPAEVGVLITAPFIREAVYSCSIAAVAKAHPVDLSRQDDRPSSKARRRLEMTHAAYPQLIRKASHNSNRAASDAIAFWLMHRSVTRDPDTWQVEPEGHISTSLLNALKTYQDSSDGFNITERQLIEFAQAVTCDPARIDRTDRLYVLRERILIGNGKHEQQIREQLLAYLLCIAGWMALDIRAMSDVLPDHLGIADPVDPADLVTALRGASWRAVGAGRSVDIRCQHPAIDYSVRDLVTRANEILAIVHRGIALKSNYLACLSTIPTRLGTELIVPDTLNGKAAYEIPHLNFQLAHDEVRELLMGEQLYDQPELAIRELYQNALDACRYRRARLQYLERTGKLEILDTWEGKIEFEQGIDSDKGPYIECRDNGVGMSRHELTSCFAKAGRRFCDLPEFIEEQNEWLRCDPPIRMYPNSQFGVGVFSYFMLADELEIETCRIDRKGRFGPQLLITIPGSGSLFRVQELGQGKDAGTKVRLYLRDSQKLKKISCVRALTSLLWVSEFRTRAKHGWRRAEWEPNILRYPWKRKAGFPKDPDLPVWWTTETGDILADGIRIQVDHSPEDGIGELLSTGVIVNLTGEYKPSLTVDRRKARHWEESWVRESARTGVRCISDWGDLSYVWLWSLLSVFPECEDLLNRALRRRKIPVKGKVGGETRVIKYPRYSSEGLDARIFGLHKAPSIDLNVSRHEGKAIDPAHIGLSKIRISDVGVFQEDAYLWRLVWEAWNWELKDREYSSPLNRYLSTRSSHPLFEYESYLKGTDKNSQMLELQVRLKKWDRKLQGKGLARLEVWQGAGLMLPTWLTDALEVIRAEGLSKHYLYNLFPKSTLAWKRVRNKLLYALLRITRNSGEVIMTLLAWTFLFILSYFLIIGSIALTKYVSQ